MAKVSKMSVRRANDETYPPKGNPAERMQNWVGDNVNDATEYARKKHSQMQKTIKSKDEKADKAYDPKGNPASQLGNYMLKKMRGK
jgi:hypothetical protein